MKRINAIQSMYRLTMTTSSKVDTLDGLTLLYELYFWSVPAIVINFNAASATTVVVGKQEGTYDMKIKKFRMSRLFCTRCCYDYAIL